MNDISPPPHGGKSSVPPDVGKSSVPPHGGRSNVPPHGGRSNQPLGGKSTLPPHGGKATLYDDLASQITGLLAGENDGIANLANAAAAIYHTLPDLNWAGFYLARGSELVLGPFQGRPACVRIPIGTGVCGTAAERRQSVLVPDVHEFPGHIACDSASRSELVVPLIRDDTLIGVLDLDSPALARFDARDQAGCEALVAVIVRHLAPILPV
jgi:GAF domain-containing protein